jgi:glycosyltransferase involved in cell wall biosynthesis
MTRPNKTVSILVIAGLGRWENGQQKRIKSDTHIRPIAEAADDVVFVCTGPITGSTEGFSPKQVSPSKYKYLTILKQILTGLYLSIKYDFDLIVSFSLMPYGISALVMKYLSNTPAHLGIIGGDLDVHAQGKYGGLVRWIFKQFNIITVAGEEFRTRMINYGIKPSRVFTVLHPVSSDYANEEVKENPEYDLLWLTRMSDVKDPHLFLEILEELESRGHKPTAALVGDGPLFEEIRSEVAQRGLDKRVTVPGWTDTPVEYYRDARIYVLTSRREMLPLTLIEAMLVGIAPVVPRLGAIPDVVEHGTNGYIVDPPTVQGFADAVEELLANEEKRSRMGKHATEIESMVSEEAVADTWRQIFEEI